MCDRKLRVAMCGRKLRCARANPFLLKLAMCVRAVFFRCAKCDRNFARFFIIKDTNFISHLNDDFSEDSFYVYYVSVRRKLDILGFLPMGFFILTFIQY
jgi:hypothetical protein